MGFADALILLGIPYDTDEALASRREAHAVHPRSARTTASERSRRSAAPSPTSRAASGQARGIKALAQRHRHHRRADRHHQHHRRLLERHRAALRRLLLPQRHRRHAPPRGEPLLPRHRPEARLLQPATSWARSPRTGTVREDRGRPGRRQAPLRHRLRHRARVARADAGRVPEVHRQCRLQDRQPPAVRLRRRRAQDLPHGRRPQTQGHHRLPLRQPRRAAAYVRLRAVAAPPRRSGLRFRSSPAPAKNCQG